MTLFNSTTPRFKKNLDRALVTGIPHNGDYTHSRRFMVPNPFGAYEKLNTLYLDDEGAFLVRKYRYLLVKISNFGTDKEKCEHLMYNSRTALIDTYTVEKEEEAQVYKKIEHYFESFTPGFGIL